MSSHDSHVFGADAPQEPADPALQDAVAGLIHLSLEDRGNLNSYTASTCDEKLAELVAYINNPSGKPQRTITDVLGQITLLYQRKAQLEAAKHEEELASLQKGYLAMQQNNASLRRENQAAQTEITQIREDRTLLRRKKKLRATREAPLLIGVPKSCLTLSLYPLRVPVLMRSMNPLP